MIPAMSRAHESLTNRLIERASTEAGLGSGEVWGLGQHAGLGLETVEGWTGPPPPTVRESAIAGGRVRGADSLLEARDEGELGGYRREVIVGSDDRVRISETSKFPWRMICSLVIHSASEDRYIGTGWLVGPRTIIT